MSKIIAIVGRPFAGKTHVAKGIVADIRAASPRTPVLIYDVNKEWGGKELPTMEQFIQQASRCRNSLIVFEEATLFFDPTAGRSKGLREMLVRKRHTGNAVILLFHALADIPLYVLRMIDTLVLLKTNDTADDMRRIRGLRGLVDAFVELQADPDIHARREFDFLATR